MPPQNLEQVQYSLGAMKFSSKTFLLLSFFAGSALAGTYSRKSNVVGDGFNDFFSYEAINDPTHGRVDYVDKATAQRLNLTQVSGDEFILRADYTSKLSPSGPGRKSVRLQSNNNYHTHVAVFNINHMPTGCGTWPSVWEVGPNWPNEGEVDIIEGVNLVSRNQMTLHTGPGCTMPSSGRDQTGKALNENCESSNGNNLGCQVQASGGATYGAPFNVNGGGWYAIERTNSFIKIWFWGRDDGGVPGDVSSGAGSVDTSNWGTPQAHFPNTQCNLAKAFGPNAIIINLTFCGDWAGHVWKQSGCPSSSCANYVDNNPSSFKEAYFSFASINVYE